jgi:hypothetical protein
MQSMENYHTGGAMERIFLRSDQLTPPGPYDQHHAMKAPANHPLPRREGGGGWGKPAPSESVDKAAAPEDSSMEIRHHPISALPSRSQTARVGVPPNLPCQVSAPPL